jgi:SAM-dependent methyltransferase
VVHVSLSDYFSPAHWNAVATARDRPRDDVADALVASMVAASVGSPGARVLDVGAGTGALTAVLARAGARVTAVDLSPTAVSIARRFVSETLPAAAHRPAAAVMSADRLGLAAAQFDAAVLLKTLWVLPARGPALAEIRRVLTPGGRIVAQTWGDPARCSMLMTGCEALADVVPGFELPEQACGAFDLTPARLAHDLTAAGFREVRCRRFQLPLSFTSAEAYWQSFRTLAGTAYYVLTRQPPADRERIDDAWLSRTSALLRDGARTLCLEWFVTSGVRP